MTKVELNPKAATHLTMRHMATGTYTNVQTPLLSDSDSALLATAICELFKSVAIDRKRGIWNYEATFTMRGFAVGNEYDVIVPDEFALRFFDFYKSFSDATHNNYAAGLERGKNLLAGLNDGTYTLNDFNEKK